MLLGGLAALFLQLWVSIRDRHQNRVFAGDPWDGRGLEWATSAPPPEYNFATIPHVSDRDPFYDGKRRGDIYRSPDRYEAIDVPREGVLGPVIGVAGAAVGFALVWHMGWLAALGLLVVIGSVIARSFARDVERTIPAAEVEAAHQRWLDAVHATPATPRELETTRANHGLAEVLA